MDCERAPDRGIDLAQRDFAAKAGSQQISYLAFEKMSERVRANVDRCRNNYDRTTKSKHQQRSLEISNKKMNCLEGFPVAQIKLLTAVSSRPLVRKSE